MFSDDFDEWFTAEFLNFTVSGMLPQKTGKAYTV